MNKFAMFGIAVGSVGVLILLYKIIRTRPSLLLFGFVVVLLFGGLGLLLFKAASD